MGNIHKARLLKEVRDRLGEVRKIGDSQSLFSIGDNAARLYVRYSKVHPGGRTFFGLRAVDLNQLEGHNSFLCFLLDDGSPPVFLPYTDFEEIFRGAQAAADGQYKVQLLNQQEGLELYVARRGRFNVEGYLGLETLADTLEAERLRTGKDLSHSQVQTLLAGIGNMKGYDIHVPPNDRNKLDWSMTGKFRVRRNLPSGFDQVADVLSEVDVVWITKGGSDIGALFEVEHSTPVYSALLRFNDILLSGPGVSRFTVVSNETRRAVFARQLFRPTFRRSGLAELTSFLEYANVVGWHDRIARGR